MNCIQLWKLVTVMHWMILFSNLDWGVMKVELFFNHIYFLFYSVLRRMKKVTFNYMILDFCMHVFISFYLHIYIIKRQSIYITLILYLKKYAFDHIFSLWQKLSFLTSLQTFSVISTHKMYLWILHVLCYGLFMPKSYVLCFNRSSRSSCFKWTYQQERWKYTTSHWINIGSSNHCQKLT